MPNVTTVCIALLGASLFIISPALAQAPPQGPPAEDIVISLVGNQCVYELSHSDDQDEFTVPAESKVRVRAVGGVRARTNVTRDRGRPGVNAPERRDVGSRQDNVVISYQTRDRGEGTTQHVVEISCCTRVERGRCQAWAEAVSRRDLQSGALQRSQTDPMGGELGSDEDVIPSVPVRPGGPSMKVEDP